MGRGSNLESAATKRIKSRQCILKQSHNFNPIQTVQSNELIILRNHEGASFEKLSFVVFISTVITLFVAIVQSHPLVHDCFFREIAFSFLYVVTEIPLIHMFSASGTISLHWCLLQGCKNSILLNGSLLSKRKG